MLLTKTKEKRLHENVLVFWPKTASTVQLCFYVIGPFSQVLSQLFFCYTTVPVISNEMIHYLIYEFLYEWLLNFWLYVN